MAKKIEESKKGLNIIFDTDLEIKKAYILKSDDSTNEEKWYIEGYVTTKDIDLGDDIIADEAIKSAENDLLENSTVLFNHDPDKPIGKVEQSKRMEGGLWVKILISKTVPDKWKQIQEGILNKFSIRGRIEDAVKEFIDKIGRTARVIKEMYLVECSLVSLPMNTKAKALGWSIEKALNLFEEKGGELPMAKIIKKDGEANVEEPKVEEPKVEEPKVEEPKVEEPKVEEPKVEEPKVEEPKVEEPKVEEDTQKSIKKMDIELKKRNDEVKDLTKKVKSLEDKLKDMEVEKEIIDLWNEKYACFYTEDDSVEGKRILKKVKMEQNLTLEESDFMISKRLGEATLPSNTDKISSNGSTEESKEDLIKKFAIKVKKA